MNLKNIDKKFLKANWKLIAAILYVIFPFDFIPDVMPFLGVGDDAIILLLTLLNKYRQHRKESRQESDGKTTVVEGEIIE